MLFLVFHLRTRLIIYCVSVLVLIDLLVSIEGLDLIEKMLQRDPTKRITARDALLHPWITRRARHTKDDKPHVFSLDGVACCIN